jgi:predicted nuclease of predicted toxin-antitoxin system
MKFLIDENLPDNLNIWSSKDFLHVTTIDTSLKDTSIWEIAQKNHSVILTKDTDFHEKILYRTPPPKVILFKLGNRSVSFLQNFMKLHWGKIEEEILTAKLVVVYLDKIEGLK